MRVLIAEDDPISQKVLESTLKKWGYEVVVTSDGKEACEKLKLEDAPKLAILDWMMPEMAGPEVCQNVRAIEGGEYFYIILLTAKGRKEDVVAGLEAGADDYLIKPFDVRELQVRVRCGQRIVDLQSELLAARDALHIQATHDALTGMLNRAAIFEALQREEARAKREGKPLAVVMSDLDHFKSVNDTFGHAAGDIVLKETSKRMESQSRAYDLPGRYGGEEFMLLLPATNSQEAAIQAERVRKSICDKPFDIGEGKTLSISLSMGIASTDKLPDLSMENLVKAADNALYSAKDNGRNRVEIATKPAE